jgi:hypothetical protein
MKITINCVDADNPLKGKTLRLKPADSDCQLYIDKKLNVSIIDVDQELLQIKNHLKSNPDENNFYNLNIFSHNVSDNLCFIKSVKCLNVAD